MQKHYLCNSLVDRFGLLATTQKNAKYRFCLFASPPNQSHQIKV